MAKIKIGQIGICHEHAAGKMRTLRLLPELFEVVGVVDDRASTAAKFAGSDLEPYRGIPFLTEEELFRIPGLEAVTVEVPNLELVPTALRCLEQNLPIHLDKPGGDDLAAFARLRRGYEVRQLPFQMGYMFRGNPAMRWILEAAKKGGLGEIFEVQMSMSHDYGGEEYQQYLGCFDGGLMFNLGGHMIDFVIALLGRPSGVTSFLKSAPGDSDRIKNNTLAVLEYPHATATLRACSREVDGLAGRRLKVCGVKGSVELCPLECFDGRKLQMTLALREDHVGYAAGTHILEFGPVRDRYEAQLTEFAGMIRNGGVENYDAEHDILVEEVLLAVAGINRKR